MRRELRVLGNGGNGRDRGCGCGASTAAEGADAPSAGAGAPTGGAGAPGGGAGCACGSSAEVHGTTRRDFLKIVGITGAGAAVSGCAPPDTADKLIPYLVQPDEVTPGVSETYATALTAAGGEVLGVHASVRDGRVIKLEGNPDFPTNRGRLSALAQSGLQDLYDPDRVRTPLRRRTGEDAPGEEADPAEGFEEASWDDAVGAGGGVLAGGGAVLLTGGTTGASDRFLDEWASATGAERVRYEPFAPEAAREAHRIAFGRDEIPSYRLDEADRIVSFGADFLETWLAPVELARRFARARAIEEGRHARFTFVGPRLSLTGMQADEWIRARAGTEGVVALAVGREVASRRGRGDLVSGALASFTPEAAAEAAGVEADEIRRLGEELAAASAPVALPPGVAAQGARATEAHLAVATLNAALGAVGRTVSFDGSVVRPRAATWAEMMDLVARMRNGEVRTLIVTGANPAFTMPATSGFAEALQGVETVVAIASHLDETAAAADWVLPAHHALEAWGDAEVGGGARALAQPVMRPVFDTRQGEDTLMELASAAGVEADLGAPNFASYLKNAWGEILGGGPGFEDRWREALKRGGQYAEVAPGGPEPSGSDRPTDGPEPAGNDQPAGSPEPAGDRPGSDGEATGAGPARPAPATAQAAPGLTAEAAAYRFAPAAPPSGTALVVYPTIQFYDGRGANRSWMQELPDPVTRNVWNSWVELHPSKAAELGVRHGDLVEVSSPTGSVTAPAYVYRGVREDTVAIPIGQGHTAYGRNARGRGVNPLDLLAAEADPASGALPFAGTAVELRPTGERARLVNTQGSDSDLGREIAEVGNVEEVREAIAEHHVDPGELVGAAWDSDPNSPYRWGMTIDLDACIGCGACVTACYAENNIPTVGEKLCGQGREMSWIRVQRFYEERTDGGFETVHQPMLCQHCGDAPCEPVCPVYAAYHTPEGLNAQVYNRCVGTRYCANNCPYKVRRFNWFTYEFPYPLNLQLNPDVTVRSKGVMEKCTFCVQRINRAKIAAKEEGRAVRDGEVVTACQQTCPTNAITFGNLKDPESEVSRLARGARRYEALGELGTRPAVIYLEDVTHGHIVHAHGGEPGPHETDSHGEAGPPSGERAREEGAG